MIEDRNFGRSSERSLIQSFTYEEAVRFDFFSRMYSKIQNETGDIVECGVGWGRSLVHLLSILKMHGQLRTLWAYDSFEGFPEPSPEDASIRNPQKGEWKSDLHDIERMLLNEAGFSRAFLRQRLVFVKGFFENTLPSYSGKEIALLHVDVDLYNSYKTVLQELYPRVIKGGVILFDEYKNTWEREKFPGAEKAIDEFFNGDVHPVRDEYSGKFYLIKD